MPRPLPGLSGPPVSDVAREYERILRGKESTRAFGLAVGLAVPLVPEPERLRTAAWARRLLDCSNSLSVRLFHPEQAATRLILHHSRWCNISTACNRCARRKAGKVRKVANERLSIIRELRPKAPLAVLVLTAKSRPWSELREALDGHEAALERFWRLPEIKAAVIGHMTSVEAVCSLTPMGYMAHVHSHSVLIQHEHYYSRKHSLYLDQPRYSELFGKALRADYDPVVHISRVRGPDGATDVNAAYRSIKEIAKYVTDFSKIVEKSEFGLTADPLCCATLLSAFHKRRPIKTGGLFTQAQRIRRERAKAAKEAGHD